MTFRLKERLSRAVGRSEPVSDLTEGSIWKRLILFALPILFSAFLQQLYSAADLMIVGNFASGESMAAVGSTGALSELILDFFISLGAGSSVVVSQYRGAKDDQGVSRAVHTSVTLSFISGIILTFLGVFLCPIMLRAMNTPNDIIGFANTYMTVIFMGIIPTIVYNMGAGILRAVGDSRRPLYYLIVSIVLNILLDLLFVAVFRWDIAGAAAATVLAQTAAMVLTLRNLFRSNSSYRLTLKGLGLDGKILKQIIVIGVPAGIQSTVFSLSNVVIQAKVNGFGSAAVAGLAAASRVNASVWIFIHAMSLATLTFVGQNIGAKKFDRVRTSVRVALLLAASCTIAVGIPTYLFGPQLLSLFNQDPEIIAYGMKMVITMCGGYWIYAMSEVLNSAMRGAGYSTVPMVISLIFICGFRLIWIALMLPVWNNIWVVLLSYPLSWSVTLILSAVLYGSGRWLKLYMKKHPQQITEGSI